MGRVLDAKVILDDKQAVKSLKNLENQGKLTSDAIASGFMKGKVALDALYSVGARAFDFLKTTVKDAQAADAAFSKLTTSMKTNGTYTAQLAQEYVKFANSIQRSTTIEGDSVVALMGKLQDLSDFRGKDLESLTKITLSYAELTDKSADATANMIAKMAGSGDWSKLEKQMGFAAGSIKSIDDALKATAPGFEQLKAQTENFSGGMTQLINIWGDFKEGLGAYITQSPAVIDGIKFTGEVVSDLTAFLDDGTRAQGSWFDRLLDGMGITEDATGSFTGLNDTIQDLLDYLNENPEALGEKLVELGKIAQVTGGIIAGVLIAQGLSAIVNISNGVISSCNGIASAIGLIGTQATAASGLVGGLRAALLSIPTLIGVTIAITTIQTGLSLYDNYQDQKSRGFPNDPGAGGHAPDNYDYMPWQNGLRLAKDLAGKGIDKAGILDMMRGSGKSTTPPPSNRPRGGGGGGGGKKAAEDEAWYSGIFSSMIDNPKLEDAKRFFRGETIDASNLVDDLKQLNAQVDFYEQKLSKARRTGSSKETIKTIEQELKVSKEAADDIQKQIDLKQKLIDLEKDGLRQKLSQEQQVGNELERRLSLEKQIGNELKSQTADLRNLMNAISPGSASSNSVEEFISKYKDLLSPEAIENLRNNDQANAAAGNLPYNFTDFAKISGITIEQAQSKMEELKLKMSDNVTATNALKNAISINNDVVNNLNDTIIGLGSLLGGMAGLTSSQLQQKTDEAIAAAGGTTPTTPAPSSGGWTIDSNAPSNPAYETWVDNAGNMQVRPKGAGPMATSPSAQSTSPYIGEAEAKKRRGEAEQAAREAEQAAKKAEDEAKKAAEEAKRRQEQMMAPFYAFINSGINNIGQEGGFAQGLKNGAGSLAGGIVSNLVPGPIGGLLGNLASKLIGGLFKKKKATKVEAVPVRVINFSDMQSALLNITKQMLLGNTSGSINRLDNLRLKQNKVGV